MVGGVQPLLPEILGQADTATLIFILYPIVVLVVTPRKKLSYH